MAAPAAAAFVGLMDLADAAEAARYAAWHAGDHLPENAALPGVVFARRWRAAALDAPPQFLITYFFAAPVAEALNSWEALARRLAKAGRTPRWGCLRAGGVYEFAAREVAPEVQLSPAAIPYSAHAGVVLHLARGASFDARARAQFAAALQQPGVLGGVRFTHAGLRDYGAMQAGRAALYFVAPEGAPDEIARTLPTAPDTAFTGAFHS